MKITIIYDNVARVDGLEADWGFACVISYNGTNVLFDTGANGDILLTNMRALDIDPKSIDIIFISHSHFDHSGGLSSFLNVNREVVVYAPPALSGIRPAKEVLYVEDKPTAIGNDFFTTGLLGDIEQSLAIKTEKGIVVIAGCSHPGVDVILNTARQFGEPNYLIGGLHGFDDFDVLKPLKHICPAHCTQHIDEIRKRFPEKCIEGGVGVRIDLP